jgi:hypothetical protein
MTDEENAEIDKELVQKSAEVRADGFTRRGALRGE